MSKEEIKTWLKRYNRERQWLADQIGINKRTVDNWLSSPKEIPEGKLKLIERLMQDDEAAEAQRRLQLLPQAQIFSVEVDLPTFRAYSAAALASDQTLEQWAIHELNAAAEAAAQTPGAPNITHFSESSTVKSNSLKVAEPPRPYRTDRTGTED
jgi:hypothetical protein